MSTEQKGAPCVEYGLIPSPVDWDNPVNTPETFAALVAEHRAWRAWAVLRESGNRAPAEMVAAMAAAHRAALAMEVAQRAVEAA